MSAGDFVTVLRLDSRANKLVERNRSGEISKQAGPPIVSAVGSTSYVPHCDAMATLLAQIADDPNATIIPSGYFPQTEPDTETEVYTFKLNSVVVKTITLTYFVATKARLINVTKV